MRSFTVAVFAVFALALFVQSVCAAPCLPITKPPLGPDPSWTGPVGDPHAKMGQWFVDAATGQETVRTHEFHDNVLSPITYGGGYAGHLAIYGYATNVQYALPGGPIIGFDIVATIENDVPAQPPWEEASNSHGEGTLPRQQYVGTLYGVKLAAEFAYEANKIMAWDPNWAKRQQSPYSDPGGTADIHVLDGYDELAWYCWTPNNPQGLQPTGDYLVPTWDFGDIAPGTSATRTLSFIGNIDPMDPAYMVILDSEAAQIDMLSNRTISPKISNWRDLLALDIGVPYPNAPLQGSNVSVFCNVPEPSTIVMLLGTGIMGLLGYAWRRRRRR